MKAIISDINNAAAFEIESVAEATFEPTTAERPFPTVAPRANVSIKVLSKESPIILDKTEAVKFAQLIQSNIL